MKGIPKPAARLLGYAETGSADWFALREGAITGSRVAACAGLSPWVSPFSLYWMMLGFGEESAENEAVEWGRRLERVVVDKWIDEHPECRVRTRPSVWQNIERPWQVCSPDGLVIQPGTGSRRRPDAILEVKTSRYDDEWGEPGTDAIPVWYRCQGLWMLDTLGLETCYFGVLFSGSTYREYVLRYDEDDVMILRQAALDMLRRVRERDRPDLDGHDATYQVIRTFHPEIDGSTVELPDDLVAALRTTQGQFREAERDLLTVRSTVAEFMGQAKTAVSPATDGQKGYKVADRRSRLGGAPYVQLCDITEPPTIKSTRKAAP